MDMQTGREVAKRAVWVVEIAVALSPGREIGNVEVGDIAAREEAVHRGVSDVEGLVRDEGWVAHDGHCGDTSEGARGQRLVDGGVVWETSNLLSDQSIC